MIRKRQADQKAIYTYTVLSIRSNDVRTYGFERLEIVKIPISSIRS